MGKYNIDELPVIIMLGQSNGGGHNDDSSNATITSTSNGFIYYKLNWVNSINGVWQSPIQTGVNNVQYNRINNGYSDIGIELKLAELMYDYTGKKHYFIKLTYGGASITDEAGGQDLNPISTKEYWDIAMNYTLRHAINDLAPLGKVNVKVLTFHQGEAEGAMSQQVASNYYQSGEPINSDNPLPYIFQQFRSFRHYLADTPIVITSVYTISGAYPYTSTVAGRQADYVNDFDNVVLMKMDDDVEFSDSVTHWDAPTQELKASNIFNIIKDY